METVLMPHVTGVSGRRKVVITVAITWILCRMREFTEHDFIGHMEELLS
jgi:hypothetical protein